MRDILVVDGIPYHFEKPKIIQNGISIFTKNYNLKKYIGENYFKELLKTHSLYQIKIIALLNSGWKCKFGLNYIYLYIKDNTRIKIPNRTFNSLVKKDSLQIDENDNIICTICFGCNMYQFQNKRKVVIKE